MLTLPCNCRTFIRFYLNIVKFVLKTDHNVLKTADFAITALYSRRALLYNKTMEDFKSIIYEKEAKFLSPYACRSDATKGRVREEKPCPLRTDFMRDRDRIVHSKSFRRLKHKTQVFISPEGDHYRTRLTHTLEVTQIGRTIARALNLNEDLIEAIALGHDLGHTPFGHAGESVLDKLIQGGFSHNEQSLRIVEFLENDGRGLNLTFEVKDGIVNHKFSGKPATLEGEIIKYADRFAYINHDIEDAICAGVLKEEDLPSDCTELLGHSKSARINSLILDIVNNSYGKPYVRQSPDFEAMHLKLHKFMFASVYTNPVAKSEEKKTLALIELLFDHYMNHIDELPDFYKTLLETTPRDRVVGDYIASFTDRYAVRTFHEIFTPKGWNV